MNNLQHFFPDWATGGGIFVANPYDAPWGEDVSNLSLDIEYFGNYSGDKLPSPLVLKLSEDGETLTENAVEKLNDIIWGMNAPMFEKIYATLSAEYNPINNYDMSETLEETVTTEYGKRQTRTDNTSRGLTESSTRTPNLTTTDNGSESTTKTPNVTETRTPNTTENKTSGIYGFNSGSSSNSDTSQTTLSGTDTKRTTGTETNATTSGNTRTETGTEGRSASSTETNTGTVTHADTGEDETTRGHTLTRSGNIGVTTTQQMLESERKLWMWNYFYEVVFPAFDKVLALQIY